jgi:hypothetical protein
LDYRISRIIFILAVVGVVPVLTGQAPTTNLHVSRPEKSLHFRVNNPTASLQL